MGTRPDEMSTGERTGAAKLKWVVIVDRSLSPGQAGQRGGLRVGGYRASGARAAGSRWSRRIGPLASGPALGGLLDPRR